jgi:BASS family bile acid:Na+ symporter
MELVILKISVAVFMAGNLLDMGLKLRLADALSSMKNVRFVVLTFLFGFVLGPALAIAITRIMPLEHHYGIGLLLMGMAPCAPFLPMVMRIGRGDLAYTAAVMLLTAIGTVIFMPIAVPLVIEGFTVSAWAIAQPLITMILIPLAIGMLVYKLAPTVAGRIQPIIKKLTALATIVLLVMCGIIYGPAMLGLAGSYVLASELLFFLALAGITWLVARMLPYEQRIVVTCGIATRNLGAAMAPLFASLTPDLHAVIVVAIGIPIMMLVAFGAARAFRPRTAAA